MTVQIDWEIMLSVAAAIVVGLTVWHLLRAILNGLLGGVGWEFVMARGFAQVEQYLSNIESRQNDVVAQLSESKSAIARIGGGRSQ